MGYSYPWELWEYYESFKSVIDFSRVFVVDREGFTNMFFLCYIPRKSAEGASADKRVWLQIRFLEIIWFIKHQDLFHRKKTPYSVNFP